MSKNRRKGNAQTASSARAAELLQASGISIPYLGLDALSLTSGLPPDVSNVGVLIDEIGANVDPELRIIFKKLTKKDFQTREKAVKELLDALKGSANDYEKIRNAFPVYASIYPKLVTDASSSIRGTSNIILALFITTLKKDAGSQLKSVIPFLFFSLQDSYNQVAKTAETAIADCFPSEEKKQLAMKTFGQETSNLCIQFLSRQHKLIQPQKFVEEESDAQRQTRLVAQSLNTLEAFLASSPGLNEVIAPTFISSQTFLSLMNMETDVKAAAFRLLKNLIKLDVSKIIGTRIPAFILQHLDSTDTLLCRNAFECFLIAGKDPKFFAEVKIDKAIVPKFLSLVRRKGLYWQVLETSLLPSISIIYDNLPEEQRERWLMSIIDSFFDGIQDGLPLYSWTKAFAEAVKYAFLKAFDDDSADLEEFLVEKVFTFLDVVLPFKDKKEVVPIVVDLLIWVQSKDLDFDGDSETFKDKLAAKLIAKLPHSTFILEPFVEASNDFTIALELLKSHECPNSTFLKVFKLLDEDAVDTSQFGFIIARRIGRETDIDTQQQLLKLFWDLMDDGQICGSLDTLLKLTDPLLARNIVEISNEDMISAIEPASRVAMTEIVMDEYLKGHYTSKLAKWLENAVSSDQIPQIIHKTLNNAQPHLELQPFLNFVHEMTEVKSLASSKDMYSFFETLYHLVFKHEMTKDEESSVFEGIKANASIIGKNFDQNWVDFVLTKIEDEAFSVEDVIRLAKLLASLSLTKETICLILPSVDVLKELIRSFGFMFILNIVCEPNKHRLFEAVSFDNVKSARKLDISKTTKLSIFYAHLAYESSKTEALNEKAIFATTAFYSLLNERAIEFQAQNGLFSSTQQDFQAFHQLFIIIDIMLQDPRFDYYNLFTSLHTAQNNDSQSYLMLLDLNDNLRRQHRRHVEFYAICMPDDFEDAKFYRMIRDCEELGRRVTDDNPPNFDGAIAYLEDYIANKRQENDAWLFNIDGTKAVKDAASCAMLKLFIILSEHGDLPSEVMDFILCGFVCTMQTVTDNFKLSSGRQYFYNQLAAALCLQLFHIYETIVRAKNQAFGLEWNEFYRPGVSLQILSWLVALEPSLNADFPQYLINKICTSSLMLTFNEMKEIIIPDELETIDEPLGLEWQNYDEKLKFLVKLALRLIFNKSNDAVKFVAVYILKNCMLDVYQDGKPQLPEMPENSDDETTEQQLKEVAYEREKKLPALFERILSPDSGLDVKVLPKLMIWDSLIQFLSELDVSTRVQYTLSLPVKYTNEILNVIYVLLPKEPEKRLKELSFKGKLNVKTLFSQKFDYSHHCGTTLDHYICNLFFRTLSTLPLFIRNWYNDLPKSNAVEVHDYIKRYLSPLLISRELTSIGNVQKGRLTIKVLSTVNEINAGYRFEDATLSLQISLPDDYPLTMPTVDTQRAIINKELHRKWLLHLIKFLSQQNGLMLDGILQWKRNIDNHLEGIEDCTICMMTVSPTTYKLPEIKCRQCRKKFHGDCLYKWFDTSNNATCPLCRSSFYY